MSFLPVPLDALITRDSFDKTKGYRQLLWQKGKVLLDAELNEQQQIFLDFMKTMLETYGDFFKTLEAFRVIESVANNTQNFEIEAGETFTKGVNGFLPADLEYEDQVGEEDFIRKFFWDADVTVPVLTTPSGSDRDDLVVLTLVIREVDSTQDPNLKDPNLNKETAIRFQTVTGITVKQGFGTFPDTTGFEASFAFENGSFVFRAPIAWLRRLDGNADITSAMIVDARNLVFAGDTILDKVSKAFDFQESVKDKDLNTPPGSPSTGDRYIIAAGGTGLWTGHDEEIAEWTGTVWQFTQPTEGTVTFVEDEDTMYLYDAVFPTGSWVKFASLVNHANLNNVLEVNPDSLDSTRDKHVANSDIFKNNFTAVVPPASNNDITQNYQPGSLWFDTVGGELFQNVDNSAAAAVWNNMSGGGAGFAEVKAVKVDGTIGVDTDFKSLSAAITAGNKKILILAPTPRNISSTNTAAGGANLTVTTSVVHELVVGDVVMIRNSNTTDSIDGIWTVAVVPTTTTFEITLPGGGGVTGAGTAVGDVVQVLKESINLDGLDGLFIRGADAELCAISGAEGSPAFEMSGASEKVKDVKFNQIRLVSHPGDDFLDISAGNRADDFLFDNCLWNGFVPNPNRGLPEHAINIGPGVDVGADKWNVINNAIGDYASAAIFVDPVGSPPSDHQTAGWIFALNTILKDSGTGAEVIRLGFRAHRWVITNNSANDMGRTFLSSVGLTSECSIASNQLTGTSLANIPAIKITSTSTSFQILDNAFLDWDRGIEITGSFVAGLITANSFSVVTTPIIIPAGSARMNIRNNVGIPNADIPIVVRADRHKNFSADFDTVTAALAQARSDGRKRILISRPKVTTITNIPTATGGNAVTITAADHGLENTDFVQIRETNSTPSINGVYQVSSVAANTFQITAPVTITGVGTSGLVGKVLSEQVTLETQDEGLIIEGEDKIWSAWMNTDVATSSGSVIHMAVSDEVNGVTLRNLHLVGHGFGSTRNILQLTTPDADGWVFEDVNFNVNPSFNVPFGGSLPANAAVSVGSSVTNIKFVRCDFGHVVTAHVLLNDGDNLQFLECRFSSDPVEAIDLIGNVSNVKLFGCIISNVVAVDNIGTGDGLIVKGCEITEFILGAALTDSVIEGNRITTFTATSATPFISGEVSIRNNIGIFDRFGAVRTVLFATTSATPVVITGLTTTPSAGKWLVSLSGSGNVTANGAIVTYGISVAGAAIEAASSRLLGGGSSGQNSALHSQVFVDVNGSQTVDARISVTSGTVNFNAGILTLERIL